MDRPEYLGPSMTSSRPSAFALTTPGRLRLYNTAELLRLPPPHWLVEGILTAGGLVGLYGPPETGKSFLAIDLALCVSSGLPWHGHSVKQGFAIYIAAEGGMGISKRVRTWLSTHKVSASVAQVGWLIEGIPINSTSEDMDVLFRRIDEEVQERPVLVVVDTLARCMESGGDENQQKDMGHFIAGIDRLRQEYKATVLIVHHTNKGTLDQERGSTAFRGAADTMCLTELNRDGSITLSCNKQKDSERFEDKIFQLKIIPQFDSCVVVDEEHSCSQTILQALAVGPLSFTELRDRLKELGSGPPPTTFKRHLVGLRKKGLIIKENEVYELAEVHLKIGGP